MPGDITGILQNWDSDKEASIQQLTPLVYAELHKIAEGYMRRARPDHTLQATALINEAYVRLIRQDNATFRDRGHFYGLAATIMRGILVDFARARASAKRGSGLKVQLDRDIEMSPEGAADLLSLHDALDRLHDFDSRKAAVLEMRYFGGLTFEEIAESLDISVPTAKRDAVFAEAWLRRTLSSETRR